MAKIDMQITRTSYTVSESRRTHIVGLPVCDHGFGFALRTAVASRKLFVLRHNHQRQTESRSCFREGLLGDTFTVTCCCSQSRRFYCNF